MKENPVSGLTIAFALGGIAALGVGAYFLLAPSGAAGATPGTTVTQWVPGQTYTLGALDGTGTTNTDAASVLANYQKGNWTNIQVWYVNGQGSLPAAVSSVTTTGYALSGTYGGTGTLAVPSGFVSVTGVPTGLTALASG